MNSVEINSLIRSKRKTIALIIDNQARLIVRAPSYTPYKEIKDFVISKVTWIKKKQTEAKQKAKQAKRKRFIEGETFLYLGKIYPLLISDDTKYALHCKGGNFILHSNCKPMARNIFIKWYKRIASKVLTERMEYFSTLTGIHVKSVKINNAVSRWGSSSDNGNINFAWRLIMAPREVIDYVVVHELAHLKEMNHSPKFWRIVGSIYPGYEKPLQWLKDNGHILTL
jgi:predicted metal-dependent hydrolase